MKKVYSLLLLAALFFTAGANAAPPDEYGPVILKPVISGLQRPIFLTVAPGDSDRFFIVEQHSGNIRVFHRATGELSATPFLSVGPLSTGNEQGLLGLAFHPNYQENGLFYINFTNAAGTTVIRRYERSSEDADLADAESGFDILTVQQPYTNHNAGWMDFGPADGYLYIPTGDGGSGNDPQNNAQNLSVLLGKILRIDVDTDDFPADANRNYGIPADNPFVGQSGRDEIWAYGLRNPWRNSFDRETHDLWIADVGQSAREEVNFQAAESEGGENYGWRLREGTIATPGSVGGPRPPGNVDPVYEYDFSDGRKAITGGYVYRGLAMPQLNGHYFLADYVANFVRSFRYEGEAIVDEEDVIDWTDQWGPVSNPSSFGEDETGELYIVSLSGTVYQITQEPWFLWRNRHFDAEQIADPAVSGPEAAPAGDGMPNLLKYAFDMDPFQPGVLPVEISTAEESGERYLTISARRSPEATDLTFSVEAVSDLSDPEGWDGGAVNVIHDDPDLFEARDTVPMDENSRRFLRLRVNRE